MRVIELLKSNGIKCLEEYAIRCTRDDDGLMILNYTQGLSPKFDPVVRECRSLVLDEHFDLVSRSFFRFFNLGEAEEHIFFLNDFRCHTKEDGSIVTLFYYNGEWKIRTRSTFGNILINGFDITWKQIVIRRLGLKEAEFQDWCNKNLNQDYSYTMELCSIENQNISLYDEDKIFMLSIFDGDKELAVDQVDKISAFLGIDRPKEYKFKSIEEAKSFVLENSTVNPRFEGIVAVDKNFMRIKIKSPTYLEIHEKYDNGNGVSANSLNRHVLQGTGDDIVALFPRCKALYNECEKELVSEFEQTYALYEKFKDVEPQRDFATQIKDLKNKAILFSARSNYGKNITRAEFWEVFSQCKLKMIRQ